MATVQDIINDAIYELGVRALGDAVSAEEAALGLTQLQDMFRAAVDAGAFGRLTDVLATAAYTAKENERIVSGGYTITLPVTITDAFDGLSRPIRDLAVVQVVNAGSDPQISLFDAHLDAWVRLDNLTLASTCPLGTRVRHGLACSLALRIAGPLQRPPSDFTQSGAAAFRSLLSTRASAPTTALAAEFY